MKNLKLLVLVMLCAGTVLYAQTVPTIDTVAGVKGWWKFDNTSNLELATVGNNLVEGLNQGVTVPRFLPIAGPRAGDGAVTVGKGCYFRASLDLDPSGNDTAKNVNIYTLVYDFRVTFAGAWRSFLQTDPSGNGMNNDGDIEMKPAGNIGIGTSGYAYDSVRIGQWYRLVVRANIATGLYRFYLDGHLLHIGNADVVDGRFSFPSINGDNQILFFGDDDGDDGDIDVAMVALYDRVITEAEVVQLGGYGHVPELKDPVGQWTFNDDVHLLNPVTNDKGWVLGQDLVKHGTVSAIAGPKFGDGAATVQGPTAWLTAKHGIFGHTADGVAAPKVNRYAVVMDFRVDDTSIPHTLLQTDSTQPAPIIIQAGGKIGGTLTGFSDSTAKDNTWHRLVVSANIPDFYNIYMDGKLIQRGGTQTVNGPLALTSSADANMLNFFADDASARNNIIDVSAITIYDHAIDSSTAVAFGVVDTRPDTARGTGGLALYLDGSPVNQYVRIGDSQPADFMFDSTVNFTVECWVKPATVQPGDPSIISNKNWNSGSNAGWGVFLHSEGSLAKFNIADGNNRLDIEPGIKVNDNVWHHIAVSIRRDTLQPGMYARMFWDGVMVKSMVAPVMGNTDGPSNMIMCIGQDGTTNYPDGYKYAGLIDEVRLWRGVAIMSQDTIQAWWKARNLDAHPYRSMLVAQYSFEEGSGNTAYDASGKGHHGTLMNGASFKTSDVPLPVPEVKAQQMPSSYSLANAYPNPFNPSTTIRFTLPVASTVRLTVYNVLGQEVAQLWNGQMSGGVHEMRWNANSTTGITVGSGVYFYRLDATGVDGHKFMETRKMVLVK